MINVFWGFPSDFRIGNTLLFMFHLQTGKHLQYYLQDKVKENVLELELLIERQKTAKERMQQLLRNIEVNLQSESYRCLSLMDAESCK